MSRYKPYPQYKDSGVEWLGEVPNHWKMTKLKFVGKAIIGLTYSPNEVTCENNGILVLRSSNVQNKKITFDDNVYVNTKIPTHLLTQQGDILICSRNGSRSLIGKNALIDENSENLAFGAFMTIFRTIYCKYIFWVLNSSIFEFQSGTFLTATINQLTTGNLNNFDVPFTSYEEQITISNFLENATCKIDTLIQKQQNLIELLKEKRQTAVENIIMQDKIISMRLGMVVDQIFRPVDRKIDECYVALGLYNRGRGLFHKEPKEGSDLGDSNFYWIQNGDLILSGQFAWEGSVALAGESENDCIVSHRYPVLRGKANILNTEYLWAFLTTEIGDFILNEHSVGSAGRNRPLNINTLMKEKIPVPNFEAQLKISRIVQIEKKISKSISKTIELLKERRTALISAVVTGKIDVREIA